MRRRETLERRRILFQNPAYHPRIFIETNLKYKSNLSNFVYYNKIEFTHQDPSTDITHTLYKNLIDWNDTAQKTVSLLPHFYHMLHPITHKTHQSRILINFSNQSVGNYIVYLATNEYLLPPYIFNIPPADQF